MQPASYYPTTRHPRTIFLTNCPTTVCPTDILVSKNMVVIWMRKTILCRPAVYANAERAAAAATQTVALRNQTPTIFTNDRSTIRISTIHCCPLTSTIWSNSTRLETMISRPIRFWNPFLHRWIIRTLALAIISTILQPVPAITTNCPPWIIWPV